MPVKDEGEKMEPLNLDAQSNKELEKLLHLIGQDEVIQRYQAIEEKVKKNKKLTELVEEIKAAQKMRFNLLTMANQLLKKKPFNEPMRKQKNLMSTHSL